MGGDSFFPLWSRTTLFHQFAWQIPSPVSPQPLNLVLSYAMAATLGFCFKLMLFIFFYALVWFIFCRQHNIVFVPLSQFEHLPFN